jgi:hypothetical protein
MTRLLIWSCDRCQTRVTVPDWITAIYGVGPGDPRYVPAVRAPYRPQDLEGLPGWERHPDPERGFLELCPKCAADEHIDNLLRSVCAEVERRPFGAGPCGTDDA